MIVVTSYKNPDLDGIACIIAYAELLNKKNIPATALYYGNFGLEVNFVKQYTNYFPIDKHVGEYDKNTEFILVDTADPDAIESSIFLKKVKEIFDHRQLVFVDKFINAKKHIELVGSCATLITEEFQKNNLTPSKNTAIYLYSAIISNTINFKNSITTPRDINAANWLKEISNLDENYIYEMFTAKSNVTNDNLFEVLLNDLAIKNIGNKKVSIAQIEMVDVERMSTDLNEALLVTLNRFKEDNQLDYLLFTGIDVVKGYNIFYTIDQKSQNLFSRVLNIPNLVPGYKTDFIIMRKQFWPKVESELI
jgi:manganese-dependent inorganic pyrophosphatase